MFDGADALLLARLQFAFTVSFHFLFPAFTIGLASYLAVLEGLWLRTGKALYLDLFRYWVKIFAVNFAMGVVSGIVLSYQFGTNWAVFSDRAGPVVGPLMAYEVLTAFFLEAGFLGVMLFGMNKVGRGLHFTATLMVALGTLLSSFWILAANSWMQTPQGHVIGANGQFLPDSWLAIIFNPSFPWRLMHTVVAAYLTTALVVGGVGAWHLLRDRTNRHARKMFSMAMWMAALVAPVQVLIGDQHGLNTLEHQPVKIMAMEGHYQSHPEGRAPLYLFGIPNDREQRLDYAVGIPGLGSLILKHSVDAPLAGLDTVPDDEQPPALIVFWSFRIMVGLGVLMFTLGLAGLWARWRGTLYEWRLLHRFAVLMAPAGFLAVIAGWVTTEVGRQPFVVYGLLRTAQAVSPLDAPAVGASLLAFVLVYFAVFGVGIWYMLRLMHKPPQPGEPDPAETEREPIRSAGTMPGLAQAAGGAEDGR